MDINQQASTLSPRTLGYIELFAAIALEVLGANLLKLVGVWENNFLFIPVALCYIASFSLLILILKYLPLGLAYAIWGGAGTAFTALCSVLIWKEYANLGFIIGLSLLIGGIVLMAFGDETRPKA